MSVGAAATKAAIVAMMAVEYFIVGVVRCAEVEKVFVDCY